MYPSLKVIQFFHCHLLREESKERLAYLPVSYSNKFYTLKNSIVSYMSSLFLCFVLYTDLSDNINNSVYSDNNDARISSYNGVFFSPDWNKKRNYNHEKSKNNFWHFLPISNLKLYHILTIQVIFPCTGKHV